MERCLTPSPWLWHIVDRAQGSQRKRQNSLIGNRVTFHVSRASGASTGGTAKGKKSGVRSFKTEATLHQLRLDESMQGVLLSGEAPEI